MIADLFTTDHLLDRVKRSPAGCWEWQAGKHRQGYGHVWKGRRRVFLAHRVSYELFNGPIPAGLFVCHRCDNPGCIHPAHLFLGTHDDNMADMVSKDRQRRALTREQRAEVRALRISGARAKDVAKQFGVSASVVTGTIRLGHGTRGAANHKTKLTEADVLAIRAAYRDRKLGRTALARKYGVTKATVDKILSKRLWKWLAG